MTALALLRAVPWQAWAVAACLAALWFYGNHQFNRGHAAAQSQYEQQQRRAADAAGKEVDRLLRGDRSGVVQFDRD